MNFTEFNEIAKNLYFIATRFPEVYKKELEHELRTAIGEEEVWIDGLQKYDSDPIESSFFHIRYRDRPHFGTIFPFQKRAFCGRGIDESMDEVYQAVREVLENRDYTLEYAEDSPQNLVNRVLQEDLPLVSQ